MATLRVEIPGPGGNIGECVICGHYFLAEILLGTRVSMVHVDGFEGQLPMHEHCVQDLQDAGTDWRKLPDGPLRKCLEKATEELHGQQPSA